MLGLERLKMTGRFAPIRSQIDVNAPYGEVYLITECGRRRDQPQRRIGNEKRPSKPESCRPITLKKLAAAIGAAAQELQSARKMALVRVRDQR
jgi:hypothetical protein